MKEGEKSNETETAQAKWYGLTLPCWEGLGLTGCEKCHENKCSEDWTAKRAVPIILLIVHLWGYVLTSTLTYGAQICVQVSKHSKHGKKECVEYSA